jgi:hypothetical protein
VDLRWLHITNLGRYEYFESFSPNTTQNFSINPGLKMWPLHSVTAAQCDCYTVWLLHSVTATPCDYYTVWLLHSSPYTNHWTEQINWMCDSKILVCEYQNCLTVPDILCRVTYFKAWWIITPLKLHMQFLVYIKRYSQFYVPQFVIRISCYSLFLPCINISIFFCAYQLVNRKVSVRGGAF